MVEAAGKKVVEQQRYGEDKSVQIVILVLLTVGLLVVIFGLMLLQRNSITPSPVYFTAMENGALFPEKPLDQPGIETNELLNWITEATMEVNTFNFIDYATVLDAANVYFTKEGYESYKAALNTAKILETVIQQKYVLTAVATDAPQLLLEKPFAGRYMWKIKIPMQFRYQNVKYSTGNLVEITVIVMRVPTTLSPNGVLILKYDLEEKGRG